MSCPIWPSAPLTSPVQPIGKKPSPWAPPISESQLSARTVAGVTSSDLSANGQSMCVVSIHWKVGLPGASRASSRCAAATSGRALRRHHDWSG